MVQDEGTHRFPLSVDKLASLFRGRGSSEIRERDEAAKQKGRVWGQKTIGATRAETKATRGDTQYGDASGSLTAHNARSRVNLCAPVCLPFLPPSPLPSCIVLRTRPPSISLFLYPKVRDSPYITRGDDTFNCALPRSRESNKFANRIVEFPSNRATARLLSLFLFLSSFLSFSCSCYVDTDNRKILASYPA